MRNHTLRTFQNLTQRMSQIMGRRDRVSVSFGGTMASAALLQNDRYHINLPAFPAGTVMSEHDYRVYNGYIDHESAHLRWTDFKAMKVPRKKVLLKHMINLIEDIRIENKQIDEYPGSRKFLDALCWHVDTEDKTQSKEDNQAEKVLGLIYKEAYAKYRDVDTNVVDDWLGDYKQLMPIEKYMAKEMPRLGTCKDTMRIAKQIVKLLPKNIDWPKSPPVEKVLLLLISGGDKREDKEAIEAALEALELAAVDHDKHEGRKKVLITLVKHIDKENKKAAQAKADLPEQGPVYPPCATHHDRVFVPSDENMYKYEKARNSCTAEITAAKKMLSTYLRSRANKSWSRGLEEGELDASQLHNLVAFDSTKIMKERRSRDYMNTAVLLMVDCSGSMDESTTRTAAIILAEALNGIRWLLLEIAGFTTNKYKYAVLKDCGRSVGLDILLHKGFDEPYVKACPRLGAIRTTGYTPLGEAYGHGFERLIVRKEVRRVLWIISDGEPYLRLANTNHSEYELMRRTHGKCRQYGIETIGTYIGWKGRDSLKDYVDRYSCMDNIGEMPNALLEIIRGMTK